MAYLDETGLATLWSKIKNKFAHSINLTTDDSGAAISLVSGDGNTLATKTIPCATTTTGGLLTNAQAQSIANIKSYTAGTGLTLSGTTFSHATGTGYNHIPTGGSSGQILKWSSAGTATWADEYSYELPTATSSTLGGIKVGENLNISDGVLSADNDVFVAVYNSTTITEIKSAIDAGKNVYAYKLPDQTTMVQAKYYYSLVTTAYRNQISSVTNTATFVRVTGAYVSVIKCDASSNWTETQTNLATTSDKLANPYALTINHNETSTTYDGSSAATVEITDDILYAVYDETSADLIFDAIADGKTVICTDNQYYFYYIGISSSDGSYIFDATDIVYGTLWARRFCLRTDGTYSEIDVMNFDLSSYTTKTYVDDAITTAISGASKYGGTVASEDELLAKDYTTGTYYVVAVASGSTWAGYENGDMFFAKTDKGDTGSMDDFDCVQTNITAMTDTEITNICTLD